MQERLKLIELSKLVGLDLQVNDRITVLSEAITMIRVRAVPALPAGGRA